MNALRMTDGERTLWLAAFAAAMVAIPGDAAFMARNSADNAVRALREVRARYPEAGRELAPREGDS